MADNYMIPLGIDTRGLLTGFTEIEEGLNKITTEAKQATTQMSEALGQVAKSGDTLNAKLVSGADAAQKMQVAAKQAGVDIEKAFSPDRVGNGLSEKITSFVAKMRDAIGKPVDFRFNFDKTAIDLLTNQLKGAKSQTEGFVLILETAKKQLAGMAQGTPAFATLSKQIQEADKFLNVLMEDVHETVADLSKVQKVDPIAEQAEPKAKSLRAQLKEMKLELAGLELAGKAGSAEFIELSTRAGNLADQLGDTSQRIARLASDTKGLDAGVSAVRGLAGAFAIGQGALAAFGEQNEEAARAIQKVQGAMAILQGIQEVANVLNKDSALSVYLQTYSTQRHTEAVVADTAATEAHSTATAVSTAATEGAAIATGAATVATEAATLATEGWTVALLSNPLVAIVAVLAVAAAAVYVFATAQKQAGLSAEQFNKILEDQQRLLDEDNAITERRLKVKEAQAQATRQNQSVLTEIQISGLKAKQSNDQLEIDETRRHLVSLDSEDKNYAEAYEKGKDHLNKLDKQLLDRKADIRAAEVLLEQQTKDELTKLQLSTLQARFANSEAERQILLQTKAYTSEIQAAKISEMREGQQKEVDTIKNAVAEKIKAIDTESAGRLKQLVEQRKEIDLEISLATQSEKQALEIKRAGLEQQISLEQQQAQDRNALKAALTEEGEARVNEIVKKYAEQRADIEFQAAKTLLDIQTDSLDKKIASLELEGQHELDVIERTNLSAATKDLERNAVERKLQADRAAVSLDYGLKAIELEKQKNVNLINENKAYAGQSTRIVALKNIEILKEELKAAEAQLELLKKSGAAVTQQELANAQARVDAAKNGLKQAVGNTPPKTIMSLLLGDDATQGQIDFATQQVSSAFNSIGQAVDSYSKLVQDRYQKIIDAKQAAIDQDNQDLQDLQGRLQAEIALRDAGYASNIQGILDQMNAKQSARDEDIKQQQQYQRQLKESQEAQANAQTALQAANLITASTNIYLKATEIGGPIAVPVAIAAITAMLAAFVLSKANTYEALQTTQFGEGGMIGGKSHAEGGQKYFSPDDNAGVMELEEGEYVTSKRQTEKYMPLLEVINNNSIGSMSDREMKTLLSGMGIHMAMDEELATALKEGRDHTAFQVNNTIIHTTESQFTRHLQAENSKELSNINKGVQRLVKQNDEQERRYEENGFDVIQKGKKKIKIRKN